MSTTEEHSQSQTATSLDLSSEIRAVPGFVAAAVAAGLKKNDRLDVALIYAPQGAQVSAVFTQSQVVAAPVQISRAHAANQRASALIMNAAIANACTGPSGLEVAQGMCQAVGDALGVPCDEVLVASTGVIGVALPLDVITDAIEPLKSSLDATPSALHDVAKAIMTTDLARKTASTTVTIGARTYTVSGLAKGSGMIAPNMATIINCVLTDAPLSPSAMDRLWREAVDLSLNRLTIDGDTSTNDTAILMSSGVGSDDEVIKEGSAGYEVLKHAITEVLIALARAIARDGEGATKLVTVRVSGAASVDDARTVAHAIANSPLVKTALFGSDANWGRVAAAAGRSGVAFDQERMSIVFGGIEVCRDGTAIPFDEDQARAALERSEVEVHLDLGAGEHEAVVWTCDFSYDYVKINGEYRN